MIRRVRAATDLIIWPVLTTLAAVMPDKWAHWVRANPEHEPEPIS